MLKVVIYAVILLAAPLSQAKPGTYQTPEQFLEKTFSGDVPKARTIWLTGDIVKTAEKLLEHKPTTRRIRYWQHGEHSAWILNEIGKHKPITVGIVIRGSHIEILKVLIFREKRGWEVQSRGFTQQFDDVSLTSKNRLNQSIDGITGATLSVRALTRTARLALYLSQQIEKHDTP